MVAFLVFISVFVVAFWGILRIFRKKPATGRAPVGNTSSNGFSTWLKPLMSRGWARPTFMIATVVILFLFWDEISTGLAFLLGQSDAGKTIGLNQESVQRWLWVPGTILGFWILLRVLRPAGSVKKNNFSIPAIITSISDGALMWTVALIIVVPVLAVAAIILDIAGVPKTIANFSRDSAHIAACATQDDLMRVQIDSAGKDLVVCPENGKLHMFAEGNRPLVFDFSPKFRRDYGHLLEGRSLSDFIQIYPPGTYPGSIVGSWRVVPLQTLPKLKYVSAWDKSGLIDITITVKAVK